MTCLSIDLPFKMYFKSLHKVKVISLLELPARTKINTLQR